MSSVGQAAGGIVGAVVGFFVGGPSGALYGAQIGLGIGGMLDPPKGPNITGPRLSDLSIQTSTYGAPIPRIYGTLATLGNIFWLEGDRIKETARKTKQGGKGGPSSTTTTYTYSATFAVGLCRGPIEGVRRVWLGSKLIYDAGGGDVETIIASSQTGGPFSLLVSLVESVLDKQWFTVYLGTEDQEPDPRMQADKGVANVSAHRGLAYIVFYDLPLQEFGNSLLGVQVKVEVATSASLSGFRVLSEFFDENPFQNLAVFSASYRYIEPRVRFVKPLNDSRLTDGLVSVNEFDVLTNTVQVVNSSKSVSGSTWGAGIGKSDSEYLGTKDFNPGVITPSGVIEDSSYAAHSRYYAIKKGVYYTPRENGGLLAYSFTPTMTLIKSYTSPFPVDTAANSMWACDATDQYVYFGVKDLSGNRVLLKFDILGAFVAQAIMPTNVGVASVVGDQEIYYAVGQSLKLTQDFFSTEIHIGSHVGVLPNELFGSYGWIVYKLAEGVIALVVDAVGGIRINTYQWTPVITPNQVSLADIVAAECDLSQYLQPADYDTTALTDTVRGYRVAATGSIRAAIEPLQAAWPFDVVQAGYQVKFVPRGGSSVATIPAELLDARSAGETPGVEITVAREMDSQLPRRVSIKHLDFEREYDQGEQIAARLNTDAVNVRDLDLPIVLSATEAAEKAEVLLYLYWLERSDIAFRLPPAYLYLEPADVVTIVAADATYECRLTAISYLPDGRLECRAKFNSSAIYTPAALGESGTVTGQTVALAGPSLYQLLDVPCLTAELNEPSMLAAMTGYTDGWPGGILFRSNDGGQTWTDVQGWSQKCTMGTARGTIASKPADVIDAASTLQVDVLGGTLESVSLLSMLSGENHFAYGQHGRWEIIAAQTCTLQGDGSYILRDFLRGRFGTEQHTGSHVAGDYVIHLNDPDVAWVGMETASIGLARQYRGITSGRSLESDADLTFTYAAVNLECLSPVYLNGNRHPTTNDWALTWTRRTRVGGEWRDLVDAALSEVAESYEIEVYSSAAFTTLKRTLTSTTPTVAYTSAQQVTDFGANQATLHVRVYQLSATVGRGFPLQTSITR